MAYIAAALLRALIIVLDMHPKIHCMCVTSMRMLDEHVDNVSLRMCIDSLIKLFISRCYIVARCNISNIAQTTVQYRLLQAV